MNPEENWLKIKTYCEKMQNKEDFEQCDYLIAVELNTVPKICKMILR